MLAPVPACLYHHSPVLLDVLRRWCAPPHRRQVVQERVSRVPGCSLEHSFIHAEAAVYDDLERSSKRDP